MLHTIDSMVIHNSFKSWPPVLLPLAPTANLATPVTDNLERANDGRTEKKTYAVDTVSSKLQKRETANFLVTAAPNRCGRIHSVCLLLTPVDM